MSFFNNLYIASNAAYSAFRRVFENPAGVHAQGTSQNQISDYNLLWAYYSGAMFDRGYQSLSTWAAYKRSYGLYRNIRLIYNPTRRLVDFYASQIYPGVLSEDGLTMPEGERSAIPLAQDTDEALAGAIAQFWQWSNFQNKKSVIPRYGAALGNVLIELDDNVEMGKITAQEVWPGHVVELELDCLGNVTRYVIEYQAQETSQPLRGRTNQSLTYYTYRKEVDINEIRYYKNGLPFAYGDMQAVIPNEYGFVPAVWVKHQDCGGDRGSPAIAGTMGKIDELNNLVSQTHDQVRKVIGAPIMIAHSGDSNSLGNLFNRPKRGPTDDFLTNPNGGDAEAEKLLMLRGPADSKVMHLAGNLPLADVLGYIQQLLTEIEADHPELSFYRKLAEMSSTTGPAVARLAGDVAGRVQEAAANYDCQLTSLCQMAVAIGGYRAKRGQGGWANPNSQQQKFSGFGLDSLARGDLDFDIMPRPLLIPTKLELAQEHEAEARAVNMYSSAGVPVRLTLEKVAGWSEEELLQFDDLKAEAMQKQQEIIQQPNNFSGDNQINGRTNPTGQSTDNPSNAASNPTGSATN